MKVQASTLVRWLHLRYTCNALFRCITCKALFESRAPSCPADGGALLEEPSGAGVTAIERARPHPSRVASKATSDDEGSAPTQGVPVRLADEELTLGVIVGEYRITGKIGEGGMGSVYAGEHPVIGKKVAIKVINRALSSDPTMVQRFVQEARSVNQIGHRNIVDIFAFGQLDDGRQYFVMEYLSGKSLRKRLSEAPLRYDEAIAILLDISNALAAAHAEGIIHRDLKPDNVYLVESKSGEQSVKLLDFGIAKLVRTESGFNTRTGAPIGTPHYMAPEQCRNREIDARTDIYAMGVIMFELFTCRLPFPGPEYIDIVNGHLSAPPPRPGEIAAVPTGLEVLILRCLAKDPLERPQSADELARALEAVAAELGLLELPRLTPSISSPSGSSWVVPSTPTPGLPATTPRPQATRVETTQRRSRRRSRGLVVAAMLAALGGGLTLTRIRWHKTVAPETLELQVVSDPPGALVVIDGAPQALRTPSVFTVPRRAEITVRVERAGFATYEERVRVAPGEQQRALVAALQPAEAARASLRVHTNVKEASFRFDGMEVEAHGGAFERHDLPPGHHMLRIEAKGYLARQESIELTPRTLSELTWTLTPGSKKRHHDASGLSLPDAPSTELDLTMKGRR